MTARERGKHEGSQTPGGAAHLRLPEAGATHTKHILQYASQTEAGAGGLPSGHCTNLYVRSPKYKDLAAESSLPMRLHHADALHAPRRARGRQLHARTVPGRRVRALPQT